MEEKIDLNSSVSAQFYWSAVGVVTDSRVIGCCLLGRQSTAEHSFHSFGFEIVLPQTDPAE